MVKTILTAADIAGRHILAVPAGITANDVRVLTSAKWTAPRAEGAGRLRLSKYSTLDGPLPMAQEVATEAGFPSGLDWAYLLTTVRERCDPPFPGTSDPSGIARAFPEGLPIREEARVAAWAVAAARRLGGAVRFDETGTVLVPRADAAIDLTVYSNLWLEPDSALALGLRVSPAFRLATGGRARDGLAGAPSKRRGLHTAVGAGSSPLPDQVSSALSKAQRAQLHQRADAYDTEMLQRKPGTDRYALRGDFGAGGLVWLEVSGGEAPMALRKLAWARFGAVAYGVRWDPVDSRDALVEFPDARQRDERSAAAGMIARLAREIHRVTGIEVLDADGFPVNPADL